MATAGIIAASAAACGAGMTQTCRVWKEYQQIPDDYKRLERLCMACQVGCTCGNCKVEIGARDNANIEHAQVVESPAAREQRLSAERKHGRAAVEVEARQCLETLADPEPLIRARASRILELVRTEHKEVEFGPQLDDATDRASLSTGHFTTDADGRILLIDDSMAQIVNMSAAAMQESGYGWAAKLHPQDFRHIVALWILCTDRKWTFSARYRFMHPYEVYYCFCVATPVMQEGVCEGFNGKIWMVPKETYEQLDL